MLFKLVLKSDQVLWNSYCSEPFKVRILNICEKGKKNWKKKNQKPNTKIS